MDLPQEIEGGQNLDPQEFFLRLVQDPEDRVLDGVIENTFLRVEGSFLVDDQIDGQSARIVSSRQIAREI